MKESLNILDLQALLGDYLDFDFVDQLAEPKRKRDGRYYTVYMGMLKPEYAPLAPDMRTLVIKEIMPAQTENYYKISSLWSPYLETVYGVLSAGRFFIALNEFIRKPSSLSYTHETLREKRSLSLEDYVCHYGCLSQQEALIFMIQLCEGLETLREFHIVHGDISPQNILLTDRFPLTAFPYSRINGIHHTISVKIIDYDIAREQKGTNHLVTTVEGTRLYAAPEILDYRCPTDRIDIYSLGCILSYMLTGKSPKQLTPDQLRKACSPRVRKIIQKCTLNYSRRYRDVKILKRELQNTIEILYPSSFLHSIPGFRFVRIGCICMAACLYVLFISRFVSALVHRTSWIEKLIPYLMPLFESR